MPLRSLEVDSPLGRLRLVADGPALVALHLPPLRPEPEGAPADAADALLGEAARQLREYFARRRTAFDLPLAPAGTAFQHEVWAVLQTIPFGETRSYGEVARALGRPGASRAVGAANARNPIAIVIPCHRVVGSDGSLTGYAGGEAAKRLLLEHEAPGAPAAQGELFPGRGAGSP